MKHFICCFILLALMMAMTACGTPPQTEKVQNAENSADFPYAYGVFLGIDDDLTPCENYKTVVIDAQYFSAEEIRNLKADGHTVYSYLNVGALENFRSYYDDYCALGLGVYQNWDEEIWIDVSNPDWQSFILDKLAEELKAKGIDGYFVDNCDVYYEYSTDEIFSGLATIMEGLVDKGLDVIINSGNDFVDAYTANGGDWRSIITGINQETVFSSIDWEEDKFSTAAPEDHEFFCEYIETYGRLGADIYLLEYTTDDALIEEIDAYCARNGFAYYVSSTLELIG